MVDFKPSKYVMAKLMDNPSPFRDLDAYVNKHVRVLGEVVVDGQTAYVLDIPITMHGIARAGVAISAICLTLYTQEAWNHAQTAIKLESLFNFDLGKENNMTQSNNTNQYSVGMSISNGTNETSCNCGCKHEVEEQKELPAHLCEIFDIHDNEALSIYIGQQCLCGRNEVGFVMMLRGMPILFCHDCLADMSIDITNALR